MFKYLTILLTALALLLPASNANAALINGFSGWTEFSDCAACDSIINFSVYQAEDNNWTDDLFFANVNDIKNKYNSLDTDAQYVYMYQVVNMDPETSSEQEIAKLSVRYFGGITSGGFFSDTVFHDGSAQIDSSNWSLSVTNPTSFPGDDPIDPITGLGNGQPTATVNAANVSLTADVTGAVINPLSLQAVSGGCPGPSASCNAMAWNFTFVEEENNHNIHTNEYSSVLYLTSNLAPIYHFGETEAVQGTGADGEIPTVVPEPISSTLFIFGAASLGMRRFRRRK